MLFVYCRQFTSLWYPKFSRVLRGTWPWSKHSRPKQIKKNTKKVFIWWFGYIPGNQRKHAGISSVGYLCLQYPFHFWMSGTRVAASQTHCAEFQTRKRPTRRLCCGFLQGTQHHHPPAIMCTNGKRWCKEILQIIDTMNKQGSEQQKI